MPNERFIFDLEGILKGYIVGQLIYLLTKSDSREWNNHKLENTNLDWIKVMDYEISHLLVEGYLDFLTL